MADISDIINSLTPEERQQLLMGTLGGGPDMVSDRPPSASQSLDINQIIAAAQPAPSPGSDWRETLPYVLGGAADAMAPYLGSSPRPVNNAQILAAMGGGAVHGLALSRKLGIADREAAQQGQLIHARLDDARAKHEAMLEAQRQREAFYADPKIPQSQKDVARLVDQFGAKGAAVIQPPAEPIKPYTSIAQAEADNRHGLLSDQDLAALKRKETALPAGPAAPETWRRMTPEESKGLKSGTVGYVSSRGEPRILQQGDAPSSSEPLVEIFDPASPTGRRLVTRSNAADKPGPASSGMTVFGPDGKPILQTGAAAVSLEKPLPADQVGKAASVEGGVEDAKIVRDYVLSGDSANLSNIAKLSPPAIPFISSGNTPIPGTSGVAPYARLDNAVDAIIRLRTGAGMPVLEKQSYIDRYTPHVTDPADAVKSKMDMLQRDLELAQKGFDAARNKPPAADTGPPQIKGDEDYAKLPSGTLFIGPDGKKRTKP